MKKLIVLLVIVFVILSCTSKVLADGKYFDVIAQQDIEYGHSFRAIIAKVVDKSNGTICYLELVHGGIHCFKEEK